MSKPKFTRAVGPAAKQAAKQKPAAKRKPPAATKRKPAAVDLVLLAEPLTAVPPPPDRLSGHGRTCWIRVCPLLLELRLLTALDLEALEAMCHQWHDYLTWHLLIQADPERAIVEFESGARQKSPEATLRDSAYDRWLKLLPRFGLSPEHLRKLKRLKEPAAGGRRAQVEVDPVAAFAAAKYSEE